ncbi:MAG: hypothetical protein JWR21_3857 [Herminiimonas sp.]|nr:hypothetical protein [Herminiimonas sp.]MDB5853831.1 hypothetical protein [Herminiimonas sp.]
MPQPSIIDTDQVILDTRAWLERAVIGLNLCPFAKAVYVKQQVRFAVSSATTRNELRDALATELRLLEAAAPDEIDTTLLIHPAVLTDFVDYNDFLREADHTLALLGLEGQVQIASFHPDYQFADCGPEDIENYTNRSPYPTLHLLREASIDTAVRAFPDPSTIYEANKVTLGRLGMEGWNALGLPHPNKAGGSDL